MSKAENIERLKNAILEDYPRLTEDDTFTFACHDKVKCFNSCCADVNIFLTPYDVLRLKNRLGITSQEFLDTYTILPIDKNMQFPVVVFKLMDNDEKNCQLVDREKGCTVYEDRPWACRMYPVGLASPKEKKDGDACHPRSEFYFLMKEEGCLGFQESKQWTVREWIENQGVPDYDEFGRLYKEITLHEFFQSGREFTPEQMENFFICCYNLDRFRDLLFKSTFFDRFRVDDALKEKIQTDDEELLRFAFRWVRFSLLGEKTLEVIDQSEQNGGTD